MGNRQMSKVELAEKVANDYKEKNNLLLRTLTEVRDDLKYSRKRTLDMLKDRNRLQMVVDRRNGVHMVSVNKLKETVDRKNQEIDRLLDIIIEMKDNNER